MSFSLYRGRTLGVVGESGSGKTVLSRSIMGLNTTANATTTGSVEYAGDEMIGKSAKQKKALWGAEMAMVFQDPMTSLNPVVTIGRQLTEHVRYHLDMGRKEANEVAIALLKSVHIPEAEKRLDNYPHQMSGGMRQRVCIAIALACGPRMLFADEPTTALDVTVQHQILNLLAEQQRDRAMAMILVTHDLGVVAGRTDEIMVMYAGKAVEKAPTAKLFAELRHPYTQGLLWSIPKITQAKHTRLIAIPGRPPNLIDPPPGCKFAPRCAYAQDLCRTEEPAVAFDRLARPRLRLPLPGRARPRARPPSRPTSPPSSRRHSQRSASSARPRSVVGLMAGSGTAHLRPAEDVLLQVNDLVVEFQPGGNRTIKAVSGISFDVARARRSGSSASRAAASPRPGKAILQLPRPDRRLGGARRRGPRRARLTKTMRPSARSCR